MNGINEEIFKKVRSMIVNLGIDGQEIFADTKLDDLGMDSLDIIDLFSTISGEFDIEISENDFDFSNLKDVGDIVKYIEDYQIKKGYWKLRKFSTFLSCGFVY